ncbi:hypothetical protein LXL04_031728 [Taraxacum kok-saghyz]
MALRYSCLAFGMILLMITQLSVVNGRSLERTLLTTTTTTTTIAATECEQSGGGMEEFGVASINDTSNETSSSRKLKMRTLEYVLASGPSKRGPGH